MSELQTVACVEDDPDIREVIELALADIGGLSVTLFPSGAEAVAGMAAVAPDLIVLDVMMPGMDGLETLGRLRANDALRTTPAIFMTAKGQPAEQERYLQAGAAGVILKPFDPMTLADQVREIWSRASAERRAAGVS